MVADNAGRYLANRSVGGRRNQGAQHHSQRYRRASTGEPHRYRVAVNARSVSGLPRDDRNRRLAVSGITGWSASSRPAGSPRAAAPWGSSTTLLRTEAESRKLPAIGEAFTRPGVTSNDLARATLRSEFTPRRLTFRGGRHPLRGGLIDTRHVALKTRASLASRRPDGSGRC
jgi:hypothetical protein